MSLSNPRALLLAIGLFAGCGGGPGPTDSATDGGRDAGLEGDAQIPDAGIDAAAAIDAGPPGCIEALAAATPVDVVTDRLGDARGVATVTIADPGACQRTYTLSSTAMRRDGLPASPRTIVETADRPSIRTTNEMFDALYALAIAEARENAVEAVSDYAFDEGRPVDCGGGCFETGRLWSYVWTRDTSFSVALGLAAIDPTRARHSLEFKTSERRGGGGLEIVQDTGSGGSWPVSTDRVSWAMGASELLAWLDGAEREAFRDLALRALRNTVERDRRMVFDGELYRGEQSFLDWREQSYPGWVADDVVHIAMSRSLSTNLLHLHAIETAIALATEAGDATSAARWQAWGDDLRAAIHARFWDEDAGLFSTFTTTELDRSPVRRWDLLGESLAVLEGLASDAEADRVLSSYPHLGPGSAPVIAPQQQETRIYHNRAEWPFVTAFWLLAAQRADHPAAGDRAARSLMTNAALFLSNVENMEITTGAAYLADGVYSGPVVSSQRQLWSVAGYLSMVQRTVFGIHARADGLWVRPWITRAMRRDLFGEADAIALRSLTWRGHAIDVVVHLPPDAPGDGTLEVGELRVDGVPVAGAIDASSLGDRARIDVDLAPGITSSATITSIDDPSAWREIFAPRTPAIGSLALEGGRVRLAIGAGGEAAGDVTFAIYRDGARVARELPGTTTSWLDDATDSATRTHCWAIETCFVATGTCSQHSAPSCFWGVASERVTVLDASTFVATGGSPVTAHGRFHYEAWGDPGDRLEVAGFTAPSTGDYLLQVLFGNGAGAVDTGITCAVKRILVEDVASGAVVGDGALVMPHLGSWDRWEDSSLVRVHLEAGHAYRFTILGDDDTVNMSAFQHFATYTAGTGGRDGAFDRVNVAELRVLRL